jgi:hypothetical protein
MNKGDAQAGMKRYSVLRTDKYQVEFDAVDAEQAQRIVDGEGIDDDERSESDRLLNDGDFDESEFGDIMEVSE